MEVSVQGTLARSYLSYFIFSIVGLLLDSMIGFSAPSIFAREIAISCFILGPVLMWWAQNTSRAKTSETGTYFNRGPYRFLRNPTHLGIVILVAGYAAISGSLVFLALTIIGYFVSNYFFKQYEKLISVIHGEDYKTYKSSTPKIL